MGLFSFGALFIGNSGHSLPNFFILGIFVLFFQGGEPGLIRHLKRAGNVFQVNFMKEGAGGEIEDAKETIFGEGKKD